MKPEQLLIPVLDAGHSGDVLGKYLTKGKQYHHPATENEEAFSIFEGVVNRQIAKRVMELCDQYGMQYIDLTVNSNFDMSLKHRCREVNTLYKDFPNIYLASFHSNAGGGKGLEVFSTRGETRSDYMANIIVKYWKKYLSEFRLRDGGHKEANFYILRHVKCPAFLLEHLFYDNRAEAKFLLSEEGQKRIAFSVFKALWEINFGVRFEEVYEVVV